MRILLIEAETDIAYFIQQQLDQNFDCDVHVVSNGAGARAEMADFLPQLLLCDATLDEEQDGISLVNDLLKTYTFEVIFTLSSPTKATLDQATMLKPANVIIKPLTESNIYIPIKLVEPQIRANRELGQKRTFEQSIIPQLSPKELRIIQLISEKRTTQEIADELFLSQYTIKNHRHNLCYKLGLKGNNALLKWALQYKKLIPPR